MKSLPTVNPRYAISPVFAEDTDVVLYKGDTQALLRTLPDGVARLVVSSPPYNLGKEYETRTELRKYLDAQKPVLTELVRALAHDGSLCWQVGNFVEEGELFPLDIFYYDIFKDLGLKLRNRIIWHFDHGLHATKRFSGRYETILWFTKSDQYVFNLDPVRVRSKYPGKRSYKGAKRGQPSGNPLGKNPSDFWPPIVLQDWERDIWDIPNVKANHPEKTSHPCQFPVELIQRLVLALTNEYDWVLDPYAGTGTSLIAALLHGRRGIGAEKEASYVKIATGRVRNYFAGTLRVRPLGKQVYQPSGNEKVSKVPEEWLQAPLLTEADQ